MKIEKTHITKIEYSFIWNWHEIKTSGIERLKEIQEIISRALEELDQ